jgi:hypothetical protein
LDSLPGYDSRATVKKSDVSMMDLAALTAKEQVEFAMFTRGSERLIVRGDGRRVNVCSEQAVKLRAQGYKWSGHTHVGGYLAASLGDKEILKLFDQERSVIYNSFGKHDFFYSY